MILNREVDFKDDIIQRRGYVVVTRDLLLSSTEEELKAFFSNFYPISINETLDFSSFGTLRYYGFSPMFRKIPENSMSPQYEFIITNENDGTVKIECNQVNNNIF